MYKLHASNCIMRSEKEKLQKSFSKLNRKIVHNIKQKKSKDKKLKKIYKKLCSLTAMKNRNYSVVIFVLAVKTQLYKYKYFLSGQLDSMSTP